MPEPTTSPLKKICLELLVNAMQARPELKDEGEELIRHIESLGASKAPKRAKKGGTK